MRRAIGSLGGAVVLSLVIAGTALGAHCINESKPSGAGQHLTVIINLVTGAVSFEGLNAAGRATGGFADVWLDVNGDGTPDVLACDDVFQVSNHSDNTAPGQVEAPGAPAVLPPIIRGSDPGGAGSGLGDCG